MKRVVDNMPEDVVLYFHTIYFLQYRTAVAIQNQASDSLLFKTLPVQPLPHIKYNLAAFNYLCVRNPWFRQLSHQIALTIIQ